MYLNKDVEPAELMSKPCLAKASFAGLRCFWAWLRGEGRSCLMVDVWLGVEIS
jgi:hypothetical protein